jgi:hypothetical protein
MSIDQLVKISVTNYCDRFVGRSGKFIVNSVPTCTDGSTRPIRLTTEP